MQMPFLYLSYASQNNRSLLRGLLPMLCQRLPNILQHWLSWLLKLELFPISPISSTIKTIISRDMSATALPKFLSIQLTSPRLWYPMESSQPFSIVLRTRTRLLRRMPQPVSEKSLASQGNYLNSSLPVEVRQPWLTSSLGQKVL